MGYIASGYTASLHQMGGVLAKIFGRYGHKPTRRVIPSWVVYALSFVSKQQRALYNWSVGPRPNYDASLAKEELGMTFRTMESTMEDMGRELIENGAIKRKEGYRAKGAQ